MSKKPFKESKSDREKKAKRARRIKNGKVDERFPRFDLRFLPKDSPEYWQEILRRHNLRLGRGKPKGQTLSYGWKF